MEWSYQRGILSCKRKKAEDSGRELLARKVVQDRGFWFCGTLEMGGVHLRRRGTNLQEDKLVKLVRTE